jgi:hydrogenase maturation factor HypE
MKQDSKPNDFEELREKCRRAVEEAYYEEIG